MPSRAARLALKAPVRLLASLALCASVSLAGCEPNIERSEQAVALPAAADNSQHHADENWPAWRGVNTAGIADRYPLPTDLGTVASWSVATPGTGNSSPVVWGEHLYLTAEIDGKQLAAQCFDRSDGQLVWQADVADVDGTTHVKNGHASASVATDGERIFAFFGSAGLYAFDLQGKQLWHVDLGEMEHRWGTASSPVLFGDTVIQLCDRRRDSYLAAFRQSDGEEVWRTPRESTGCWTTPVVIEEGDGQQQLIVNGTGAERGGAGSVIAYDPHDGRQLWSVEGTTHVVCPTAILGAGLIVSTSGRNGPIMALRPHDDDPTAEPSLVWRARRGGPYVPTGVAYRNRLYLVNDGGVLSSYNLGNGDRIWDERVRGPVTTSLVAGDGKLYTISEHGELSVLAASDEPQLLGEYSLNERCLATPALSAGQIFIRTEGHLHGFGERAAAASRDTSTDDASE